MVVVAVYLGFVIGNLVLMTAYALVGLRLAPVCRVAFCLNALALAVLLLPVPGLLLGLHPPSRAAEAAMVLLRRAAVLLAECIFLLPLHLRTTRHQWRGVAAATERVGRAAAGVMRSEKGFVGVAIAD